MPPSRRNDLIDAALTVFCQHGFHTSGLDRVLQAGGLSKMTLYNHFKSKDELIVAALRRRDEQFRNKLMKRMDAAGDQPLNRLLAIFDFHTEWFAEPTFRGCMFINATAEFVDNDHLIRRVAAEHKHDICRLIEQTAEAAGFENAPHLAMQLNLLLEGAIVSAQNLAAVGNNPTTAQTIGDTAKAAAQTILAACPRPGK